MLQMMDLTINNNRYESFVEYRSRIQTTNTNSRRRTMISSNKTLNKKNKSNSSSLRKSISSKIMGAIVTMILIVSLSLLFGSKVNADNEVHYYKYYQSYTVQNGDTLWKIAGKFAHDETRKTYMKEVAELNNMGGTYIVAGQKLVIPYYSTEFNAGQAVAYTNY
ncbi:MAG: LysM peptidoglycan-binding domain-containing protein [Lachnospiraceae bacterium]|nr:LysM peptidoglycan-binding domain-containing protein [Lachnospiraceae bacterium]